MFFFSHLHYNKVYAYRQQNVLSLFQQAFSCETRSDWTGGFYRRRWPGGCDSRGTKSRPPSLVRLASAHLKDGYGAWEVYKDCDTGVHWSRRVACVRCAHPEGRDLEVYSVYRGVNATWVLGNHSTGGSSRLNNQSQYK